MTNNTEFLDESSTKISLQSGSETLTAIPQPDIEDEDFDLIASQVLETSHKLKVKQIIFDFSKIDVMDGFAFQRFQNIFSCVKLLGVKIFVIGIRPGVAVSLLDFGLCFKDVVFAQNIDQI